MFKKKEKKKLAEIDMVKLDKLTEKLLKYIARMKLTNLEVITLLSMAEIEVKASMVEAILEDRHEEVKKR